MMLGPTFVAAIGISLPVMTGLWLMPRSEGEPSVPALALRSARHSIERMRTTLREIGDSSIVRPG
ncbi:MAG TPA: hypothetical protein VFL55_09365 [Acetobacteraceae bacterium]|nr:hypothetical protein [Acetobacteraceae bacterium]